MFHKHIPFITMSVHFIIFYFIIFYSSLFLLNKQTYIHTYTDHKLIMTYNGLNKTITNFF